MTGHSTDLKRAGLKVTHPRRQILKLLETTEQKHMTADDIYRALVDQGEEISLATVYRVLSQFEAAHLVRKHMFEDSSGRAPQACYELDEGDHHDHMICVETGEVFEFFDEAISLRQKQIAQEHGFEIVDHSMVLYVKRLEEK